MSSYVEFGEVELAPDGTWTAQVHGVTHAHHREVSWVEGLAPQPSAEEAIASIDAWVYEQHVAGTETTSTFNTYVLGRNGAPI